MSEAKRIHESSLPESQEIGDPADFSRTPFTGKAPAPDHDWPPAANGASTCRKCGVTVTEENALAILTPCGGASPEINDDVIASYGATAMYPSGVDAWLPLQPGSEEGVKNPGTAPRDTTQLRIEALKAASLIGIYHLKTESAMRETIQLADRFLDWLMEGWDG